MMKTENKNPQISSSLCFYNPENPDNNKKIITKTNYPLKDDQKNLDDQPSTWKKNPPKVGSNKLPSAFGTIFHKTLAKQKFLLEDNKNAIKNIENIINIQEFKQTSQMLSPLKINSRNKNRKNLNKKNPLEPLRSYMVNFTKLNEELSQLSNLPEMHKDRINQMIADQQAFKNKNELENSKLRLQEMITLTSLKHSSHDSFKKMLHVPDFKLYALREIPILSKESRKILKEKIGNWQNNFNKKSGFLKIFTTFWNVPEGYLTILLDFVEGGSLKNLIYNMCGLPEPCISMIAKGILPLLEIIHEKGFHGGLVPSQILIGTDSNIQLSIGISSQGFCFPDLFKISPDIPFYFGSDFFLYPKYQNNNFNDEIGRSLDIFNIGLLLLFSIIGTFEIFSLFEINTDHLSQLMFSDKSNSLCCLIHSEDYLLSQSSDVLQTTPARLYDFLKKKSVTNEFINFLCCCLQLNYKKRASISSLKNHEFFKREANENSLLLLDVLKISNFQEENLNSELGEKQLEKIGDAFKIVLQNSTKKIANKQMNKNQMKVVGHIAHELGLNVERVLKFFSECLESCEKINFE